MDFMDEYIYQIPTNLKKYARNLEIVFMLKCNKVTMITDTPEICCDQTQQNYRIHGNTLY